MTDVIDSSYNSYLTAFTETPDSNISAEWLEPVREEARRAFSRIGFPTRRDEDWRYFSVSPIVETPFKRATEGPGTLERAALAPYSLEGGVGTQLVFVNGAYDASLSTIGELPTGVTLTTLAKAIAEQPELVKQHLAQTAKFDNHAFVALNTAAMGDGVFFHIARNVVFETPIHLLFVSQAGAEATVSHPRNLFIADENSQATLIESYVGVGENVYFTNAVTEVVLGANAVIDHYKVQREGATAFHVATMELTLGRTANFTSHAVTLGGSASRSDVNAFLGAEGIVCTLNCVYYGNDRQVIDNHTSIDHAFPHCDSHEIYKGILDGKSRGVFNGKIFVREDAQKTDAKQTNQTLLLSDDAQINTKPQLEIFADDVKCTHGATVGQLSDEALFYLRTRGIPVADARNLLTYAFASDIVSRIKVEALRAQIDRLLLAQNDLEGVS
jgi:Fe-S cluster assembly protein SufD